MKRRPAFLAVTVLIVVGLLLVSRLFSGALHVSHPASTRNLAGAAVPIQSHYTSRPMTLSWDSYEEITSDPDVWHLQATYRLYDQDGKQVGYQSLVSTLRPGVDEPGSGTIVVDDVRPTWLGLEPGITYTVMISASWSSAYHDNVAIVFITQEPDADGYYIHDIFQTDEWYDDCPDNPTTSTPWPDQPTLTPRPTWETQPTLIPKPTPTCRWTATPTTGPPEPSPSPYSTEPPIPTPTPRPTATEYPSQPP